MKLNKVRLSGMLLLCALVPLSAQEKNRAIWQQITPFEFKSSLEIGTDSDVGPEEAGSFSTDRWVNQLDLKAKAGDLGFLLAGFTYLQQYEDFDLAVEPFSEVESFQASLGWTYRMDSEWTPIMLAAVDWAAADDGEFSDGRTGFGVGGLRYTFSPDLKITFGVLLNDPIDEDLEFFPVISIEWQITERWKLRTFNGIFVDYDLTGDEQQTLDFSVRYETLQFSIGEAEEDGILPARDAVIDESFIFSAGYSYNFVSGLTLRAFVSGVVGRDIEFYRNSRKTATWDADTSVRFGLQGGYKF